VKALDSPPLDGFRSVSYVERVDDTPAAAHRHRPVANERQDEKGQRLFDVFKARLRPLGVELNEQQAARSKRIANIGEQRLGIGHNFVPAVRQRRQFRTAVRRARRD